MSGETSPNPNNQDPAVTEWDSLSQFDAIEQNLQDDFLNIDDMLKSGRINEEQAEHFRKEVQDKADREWQSQLDSDSRKYLDDENANIDDMLRSGRINEEQAAKFRKEVKQKAQQLATSANEQSQSNAEDADVDTKNEESPDAQTIKDEESEKEATVTKEKEIAEAEEKEKQEAKEVETAEAEKKEKSFNDSPVFRAEMAKLEGLEGEEKIAAIKALMAKHEKAIAGTGEKEKESDTSKEIEELLGKAERQIDEEKAERIEKLKEELEELRPKLAELYARNRRLFIGAKNRAEYNKVKREYEEKLSEYLSLNAREVYESKDDEKRRHLQERFDEIKAEIEADLAGQAGEKTPEELEAERQRQIKLASKILKKEYEDQQKELKTEVNAEFLEKYLEQENSLWEDTNTALDEGTLCRKFVSKVLTNKYLKGALIGAAIAGLAVTGVGLVAGTTAISFGLGAGTALGAAKGGLSALLMSRQSSKNSALNEQDRATREQNIREQLKNIDFLAENDDVKNISSWMMEEYDAANQADRASNRKRTAIAATIGAAAGAIMGSLHFNSSAPETTNTEVSANTGSADAAPTTETKVIYDVTDNLNNVNIQEGGGAYDTFTQMGGDPANIDRALEIMYQIDPNYGLSPGSNGEVAGFNGLVGDFAHTYPGNISDWPPVAQDYIREVAEAWAREGLINANQTTITTTINPVFDVPAEVATKAIPDAFESLLNAATEWVVPATIGAIPGAFATRQNRAKTVEAPEITGATPTPETPEDTPETPNNAPETPNNAPEAPEDDAEEPTVEATEESQPEEPTASPEQEEPGPTESEQTTPEQTAEEQVSGESEENPAEESREGENRDVRELISSRLGDRLSEKDIHMLSINNSNNNDNGAFADWWNDEVDENKRAMIRQFYQDESDNSLLNNSAFKLFLSSEEPAGFQAVQ